MAVWNTAFLAADLLTATDFFGSAGSNTLMPFYNSVTLIMNAFKKPADDVAR